MGSVIRSVSMTPEEDEFLTDYRLSPSQLLKEKIWEFKGALKTLVGEKIARMAKVINDQAERIEMLEGVIDTKNGDAPLRDSEDDVLVKEENSD